jgi:RNA polymerase sigma factor (TIGR02999 family)
MRRQKVSTEFLSGAGDSRLSLAKDSPPGAKQQNPLDNWFSVAYTELRRLAASVKRADASATMSTSTLVHEAWVKLANTSGLVPQSELHFKRIAAGAMRQIVVDEARRRRAYKRGGGVAPFVTLDDSMGVPVSSNDDLLRLDAALDALAQVNPRQGELVQLRFFGGYDVRQVSAVLGIAESTALRDWRVAKAWLAAEIRRTR